MKTAIDALERMSRMLFNYHDGAPVKAEDLQAELKTALTALKSLEGPRLTVEEAMDVVEKWHADDILMSIPHSTQYEALREAITKSANP